jgi:hypothetical protein
VRSQTIISAGSRSSLYGSITDSWNSICYHSVSHVCHDLINVGTSLGKHICGLNLENGQNKSWRALRESSLGNCCLKSTGHAGQYKVLISPTIVCGVLLTRHWNSRLGDSFPPASVGHTNEPSLIIYRMVVIWVGLVYIRVLGCWQQTGKSAWSQNKWRHPVRIHKLN